MGLSVKGRLVVRRGEIWWADLPDPQGSTPGFTRPVVINQSDLFNDSNIRTVVVATFTSNIRLGNMPGNILVERIHSALPKDSVVNVSQIMTVDKSFLRERVGRLPDGLMSNVESGLKLVLGL